MQVLIEHRQGNVSQQRRQDPPCGVPVLVSWKRPDSVMIPALRNAFTNATTRSSLTRARTRSNSSRRETRSKHASISASITQR